MKTEKIAKKYCNQVSIRIPCPRKKKQYLLDGLYKEVSVFLNRNPEAELKDVVEHFGQPQSIAAAYVDDLGTDEILDALYARRRMVATVTAVLGAILVIWIVFVTVAFIDAVRFNRSQVVDSVNTESAGSYSTIRE